MPDNTSSNSPARESTAAASAFKQAAFPLAIVMLVGWAVWTFVYDPAPGWVHLFLTLGVFLLIWAIVARDDRASTTRRP